MIDVEVLDHVVMESTILYGKNNVGTVIAILIIPVVELVEMVLMVEMGRDILNQEHSELMVLKVDMEEKILDKVALVEMVEMVETGDKMVKMAEMV